jgi:cytochrome c-type biogenesis protein CcsB
MILRKLFLLFLLCLPLASRAGDKTSLEAVERLIILDEGRTKPLGTFAWENLRNIYGKLHFGELSAVEVVLGMAADPERWGDVPLIRIDNLELRRELGFVPPAKYFSYNDIIGAENFNRLLQDARIGHQQNTSLSKTTEKMRELYEKLLLCSQLLDGTAFTLVPDPTDSEAAWSTPLECRNLETTPALLITQTWNRLLDAIRQNNREQAVESAALLGKLLKQVNPEVQPAERAVSLEMLYNHLRPFRVAMIIFLILVITGLLELFFRNTFFLILNMVLLGAGIFFHSLGIYLIAAIAGRAPFSNLFESLVFIIWGFLLLSFLFNLRYRTSFMGLISGLLGFIAMVLAHHSSIDIGINPLVPVLRSSWLTYHVSIILISYSSFALAMGLGHVWLAGYALNPGNRTFLNRVSDFTYRVLQLGNLTLAVGIILGALWANESWGRYWGWDPKETWSLITWFVYLAILHARLNGWIKRRGLAVWSVISFAAVIMTYYGVNYFLTGLHSYASGHSEGIPWLLGVYVGFETLFLVAAYLWGNRKTVPPTMSN